MPSYYTVVQYVPDPVTDERVNVGVLTIGDGKVRARFLESWTRVAQFGAQKDMSFLNEAAETLAAATEEDVRNVASSWNQVVQLTELRASLLDPETLLHDIATRFLRSTPAPVKAARSHQQAASFARKRVRDVLTAKLGREAGALVKQNLPTIGRHAKHRLDVGIQNGKLIGGAFAVSFEVERALEREIRAIAFSVEDVREALPRLPLAVVGLPPRDETRDLFFFARDLFPQFDVPLVIESEVDQWADKLAGDIHLAAEK
jgi:hypothetical protein